MITLLDVLFCVYFLWGFVGIFLLVLFGCLFFYVPHTKYEYKEICVNFSNLNLNSNSHLYSGAKECFTAWQISLK